LVAMVNLSTNMGTTLTTSGLGYNFVET